MKSNNSFKKNTLVLLVGTFLNKGLQFLAIPFFSRWLSAEEYGKFDLIYTYVALFIPIITLSTHEAIFRLSVDGESDDVKKNVSNGLALDCIIFTIIAILMLFFGRTVDFNIQITFLLYLFAEVLATYLKGCLRADKKLDIFSYSMCISTVFIISLVTVFVFFLKLGLWGILAGYGLGTLVGDFIIILWGKWGEKFDISTITFRKMKELVNYSFPLVPNDISWWVMNASDRQIINVFFGDLANGVYAIAHKVPALCSVMFNMVSISWQQEIVERIVNDNYEEYINGIFDKLATILFSACACLLSGSFILYYFVFDIKYFEAIFYSPILILAAVFMAISQFLGGIQIALKRPKQNGMTTVCGAIVNIFAHILLVKWIGLYAAAVSTLGANMFIAIFRAILLRKIYKIKVSVKVSMAILLCAYSFVMAYFHEELFVNIFNVFGVVIGAFLINGSIIKSILKRSV